MKSITDTGRKICRRNSKNPHEKRRSDLPGRRMPMRGTPFFFFPSVIPVCGCICPPPSPPPPPPILAGVVPRSQRRIHRWPVLLLNACDYFAPRLLLWFPSSRRPAATVAVAVCFPLLFVWFHCSRSFFPFYPVPFRSCFFLVLRVLLPIRLLLLSLGLVLVGGGKVFFMST